MGDNKQGDQGTSGKPSKFAEQNKGTEERKTADSPRQGDAVTETPATETAVNEPKTESAETTETPKETK